MPVHLEHIDDVAGADAETSGSTVKMHSPAVPGLFTNGSGNVVSWEEGACRLPYTLTSDGRAFWEMPSAVISKPENDEDQRPNEPLTIRLSESRNQNRFYTVELSDELYDEADQAISGDSDLANNINPQLQRLDHAFTAHIDFIRRRTDQGGIEDAGGGCGQLTTGRIEDTGAVADAWFDDYNPDKPPYRLIVRLALKLDKTLQDLCNRPRKLLQQERLLQPIGSVQRVDAACLRWISRQPGRTIQQKAGPRQQVMGIVRREQADTLENRLVRDVLKRSETLARRYLAEFGSKTDDEYVQLVTTFYRRVRSALRETLFAEVSDLEGAIQPNYVLQYESRYVQFWRAWGELISQRKLRDDLFRWRRRFIAEIGWLATIRACRQIEGGDVYRSDAVVQNQPAYGEFIDRKTAWLERSLTNGLRVQIRPNTQNQLTMPCDYLVEISRAGTGHSKQIAVSARLGASAGIGMLRLQGMGDDKALAKEIVIPADAQTIVNDLSETVMTLGGQL